MILNTLAAAAMLLWVNFAPVSIDNTVEHFAVDTMTEMESASQMDSETEQILIEEHAAPHWGLKIEQAWNEYYSGTLVIKEMVPQSYYQIYYSGTHIDVILGNNL